MITDTITRFITSRPFKILLGLFVLLAAGSQAVPYIVDTQPYVEKVSAKVREATGATLLVKGGSHVQLLPRPALIMKNVEVAQPDVPRSPSLGADIVEINVGALAIMLGDSYPKVVRASGVALTVEKEEGAKAQWGFVGLSLMKTLASIKPDHPVDFELFDGRISLADVKTGESTTINAINITGGLGEETNINGAFTYNEMPMQFTANRKGAIGATPVELSVHSGTNSASLKGSMDFTADHPLITAKLEAASDDVVALLDTKQEVKPASTDAKPLVPPVIIPLKLSADYVQKEGLISLSGIALETLNSQATGKLDWGTGENGVHMLLLDFSVLDASVVRHLFGALLAPKPVATRESQTLVDKDLSLQLDVKAAQVKNGAQVWNNTAFNGTFDDGVLTVNQLSVTLPGDSKLALFGLLSISDTQGLRFEGNTEASGNSLRELLTVFDESAGNLPEVGFGAFKFRSNLFVSKELLRLSEADAQFSELSLKGGLVAYFDKKPRMEADIALRDINFDYFRDSWRAGAIANKDDDAVFLRFDRGMNFDWLKKLSASIDFRVSVQGFTFLERKGTGASFRIFAQSGEIGVYNAKFVFPQDTTEANLKFDVNGAQPSISLVLNTSELNTNYFSIKPAKYEVETAPVATKAAEALPEMAMPNATPEEELRQMIQEEAAAMGVDTPATPATPAAIPTAPVTITDPEAPATPATPVELTPLSSLKSLFISRAYAQEAPPVAAAAGNTRWPETLIDMSIIEGISGNFDISIGRLQHKELLFQNFKMLAKLERNLLSFQTLTFMHWGGSFSLNGTIFGGKVPGLSIGFIIASVDIQQMLSKLLGIHTIGGRASLSGVVDTSGVNMLSWVSQATGKMLFAGRGVSIQGFDIASVLNSVNASRTAADVFNNVNLSLVGGAGEYTADGAINLQGGMFSTPGIALKTGRIVGTVTGDLRLIPWDVNLNGTFKFPELSAENVPSMIVQWNGPVGNTKMQTDTQALEAFVSKRIIGN